MKNIILSMLFLLAMIFSQSARADPYADFVCNYNKKLTKNDCEYIVSVTRLATDKNKLFFHALAIMGIESGYTPNVVGSGGSGLMQLTKVHKPKFSGHSMVAIAPNIIVGVWVLEDCASKTRSVEKMFSCYNGGGTKGYAKNALAFERKLLKEVAYTQKPSVAMLQ